MNLFQDNYTSVSYCLNDRYLELRRCNRYLKGKKITKSVINNSIKILGIPYTQAERKRLYSFIEKNKGKPFLIYLILQYKIFQEIYNQSNPISHKAAEAQSRKLLDSHISIERLLKPKAVKPRGMSIQEVNERFEEWEAKEKMKLWRIPTGYPANPETRCLNSYEISEILRQLEAKRKEEAMERDRQDLIANRRHSFTRGLIPCGKYNIPFICIP